MLDKKDWEADITGKIVCFALNHGVLIDKDKEKELIEYYKDKICNYLYTGDIGNLFVANELYSNLDVLIFERLSGLKRSEEDIEKAFDITMLTLKEVSEKIRQEHKNKKT